MVHYLGYKISFPCSLPRNTENSFNFNFYRNAKTELLKLNCLQKKEKKRKKEGDIKIFFLPLAPPPLSPLVSLL